MDINEFILFERKRGDCYKLLSACFYLPKKEIYLEEKVFEALTLLLNTLCPDAAIFSAAMEETIQKYSNEDLAVEYARLFVGPYELKAPPYGSVYLGGARRVMGNSTMGVIKLYEETGLVMDKDFKELPDHIAVELEFMYYLIY
ncbi:MAG: molecular chaperone TorD family protein [Deltaproteobacteria bacterium]|nr:molecular chaperone TorD family protein [Deltaproteobacteria bacterium]